MYYIYHIPNVKIGCTTNPTKRPKDQGYAKWEILETHDCIYYASEREQELQKKYGYQIDTTPYYLSRKSMLKNRKPGKFSKQARLKGAEKAKESCSKIVLQYSLDGKLIKEWPSYSEAFRKTNIFHIHGAAGGTRKTAGGFIWKYK